MSLEWYVYVSNFNAGEIVKWNVFDHWRFMEDLKKAARKYRDREREQFEEVLRRDLKYYYWSKCEWEVIIDHLVGKATAKSIKVDVWDQIEMNWDIFKDYVWAHRADLRRREKKDEDDHRR